MKTFKTLLLTILLIIQPGLQAETEKPDFGLQTLAGESHSLDTIIGDGKWTLIMFWATDCNICRQQEPLISAFHEKHRDSDAKVVGIAIDGFEKQARVKQHLQDNPLSYPNYIGSLPMIGFNYQALTEESFRGTPTYLLFTPEGELVGANPGPMKMQALESFIDKRS
ncbi:MAG: TlpA disulfide reductase family protein [Gammaproteobacteria bacterium]